MPAKREIPAISFTANRWLNIKIRELSLIAFTTILATSVTVRQVVYWNAESQREYTFITNHFELPAQTIADIYKQRWQVELFFKWIKQNLQIKAFVGLSKNAVMTQIWVAMCMCLLLAYLKFSSKVTASMQQILRLISVNVFSKRNLIELIKQEPPPQHEGFVQGVLC